MGYGAVVPNGYGVSYNLQPSNIIFCVASFFTEHITDSRQDTIRGDRHLKGPFALKRPFLYTNIEAIGVHLKSKMWAFI